MENHPQRPKTSDEIDLAQFFRWIGRGFSNLGDKIIGGIAGLRNTFYKNRVFFIGIMIFGLILGFLYSELLKREYYKSTMVFTCDYLSTPVLKSTIDKFNLLAREKDTEGIQALLNLDSATANNIQRFEFKPFVSEDDVVELAVLREQLNNVTAEKVELIENVINRLEIQNKNSYEISVFVYDPQIVKPLEKALVDYFSGNSYISRRIEVNRKMLEVRRAKLQSELQELDSLKLAVFQNYQSLSQKSRGSNNVWVGGEEGLNNPIDLFVHDLELHEELLDIEKRLALNPDFEVVDGFTSFKEPASAGLADILAISLILSILIGYLVLGAYRLDRMLAEYPKRH